MQAASASSFHCVWFRIGKGVGLTHRRGVGLPRFDGHLDSLSTAGVRNAGSGTGEPSSAVTYIDSGMALSGRISLRAVRLPGDEWR